jgi:uncharacterized membrane protein
MSVPVRRSPAALTFILAILLSWFAAAPALAFQRTVTLCNLTTKKVLVAWAYERAGAGHTTSEGWRTYAACSCNELFSEDLRATEFYFLVAESGTFKKSGDFTNLTNGRAPLCVETEGKFKIGKRNASRSVCENGGGHWVRFQQDNAQVANHKINFRLAGGPQCNR